MRDEIAKPAASSAAELILLPEDNRSIDWSRLFCVLFKLYWALNADRFVLIATILISFLMTTTASF